MTSGGGDTTGSPGTGTGSLCGEGCYEGDVFLSSPGDDFDFDGVACINGAVIIESSVGAVDGLSSLACIEGLLGVDLSGEDLVLSGLSGLEIVHGDVRFSGEGSITNLDGFKSLKSISGSLEIYGDGMMNLEGMGALTTVENLLIGQLNIDPVESMVSVSGLNSLVEVTNLLVVYGTSVSTLAGFEKLSNVGHTVAIYDNILLPTCMAVDFAALVEAPEVLIGGNLPDECGK